MNMNTILSCIVTAAIAFVGGVAYFDYVSGKRFQEATGIPLSDVYESKSNCETTYKEKCKIYGGFAPESAFEKGAE